jgi:hypothetical protein
MGHQRLNGAIGGGIWGAGGVASDGTIRSLAPVTVTTPEGSGMAVKQ